MILLTALIITLYLLLCICKRSIKHSHKHFLNYLANEGSSAIFLQLPDKDKNANITPSFNPNKASGPNSIPYRILFLLKMKF